MWIQVMGLAIVPCVSTILLEESCLHMASTSPRSGPSLDPSGTLYHFLAFPQNQEALHSEPTRHRLQNQDPVPHPVSLRNMIFNISNVIINSVFFCLNQPANNLKYYVSIKVHYVQILVKQFVSKSSLDLDFFEISIVIKNIKKNIQNTIQ